MFILQGSKNFVKRGDLQQMMSNLSPDCGNDGLKHLLANDHTREQFEVKGGTVKLSSEQRMNPNTFERWNESEHEVLLRYRLHEHFPFLREVEGPTFKKLMHVAWKNLVANADDGLSSKQLLDIVTADPRFKDAFSKPLGTIERLMSLLALSSVCNRTKENSRVLQLSVPEMRDFSQFQQNLERFVIAGARSHWQLRFPINAVVWQRVLYGPAEADPATLLRIRRLCAADNKQLNIQIQDFVEQVNVHQQKSTEIVVAEEPKVEDTGNPLWKRILNMMGYKI